MVPARLLDLTRTVSRLGKGPMTGIDRVEFAYLERLIGLDTPVLGLVRTRLGFLLLDRGAMQLLHDGQVPLSRRDVLSRITLRHDPVRARAETAVRRLAVARSTRKGLARLLSRHLPLGSTYLNTGHANLEARDLMAMRQAGLRVVVLVHDTIPLDHPEYARSDTIAAFRRKMQAVALHSDLVIHSTKAAQGMTEAQFQAMGRVPDALVAPLGVPRPIPDADALSALQVPTEPPYFLCLGTIEPRKNHALLLDVWQALPKPAPRLFIVGRRGWANAAVFSRLDALPASGPVQELAGISDGAVAALLNGASALLFPSFVEGFGLPALEAAALGVPVVVSDQPVFHELLGDFPIYLDPSDSYSWTETISRLARTPAGERKQMAPPTWQAHFNLVLSRA